MVQQADIPIEGTHTITAHDIGIVNVRANATGTHAHDEINEAVKYVDTLSYDTLKELVALLPGIWAKRKDDEINRAKHARVGAFIARNERVYCRLRDHSRPSHSDTPMCLSGQVLPTEVILKVLGNLKYRTLLECKLVCRALNAVASDPILYKRVPHDRTGTSSTQEFLQARSTGETVSYLRTVPNLEIWEVPKLFSVDTDEVLGAVAEAVPNLRKIDLRHNTCMDADQVDALCRQLPIRAVAMRTYLPIDVSQLTELRISDEVSTLPTLSSDTLEIVSARFTHSVQGLLDSCPRLCELRLPGVQLNERLRSTSLRTLGVCDITEERALELCPNLHTLHLSTLSNVRLASDSVVCLHLRTLQHTGTSNNLSGVLRLKRLYIGKLSTSLHSPTLEELYIEDGTNFQLIGCRLPQLHKLVSSDIVRPSALPMSLQYLAFRHSNLGVLGSLWARLPTLRNLTTLDCAMFKIGTITSPSLRKLRLNCFANAQNLRATVIACPQLKYVFLHGRNPWMAKNRDRSEDSIPCDKIWSDYQSLALGIDLLVLREYGPPPPALQALMCAGKVVYTE